MRYLTFVAALAAAAVPVTAQEVLYVVNGGVGIFTNSPAAELEILGEDGAAAFRLNNTSVVWSVGVTGTDVVTFNKIGSGGQEMTVRERNHAVSTLDVQGHVEGTSFKNSSSRSLKQGFAAVDGAVLLDKLNELPVTSWVYKTNLESRHIGPVAEDWQRVTGLGDGKTISTVDAQGFLLAVVKELQRKNEEQAKVIKDLAARVEVLEQRRTQ